jgi:sialidase-1
MMTPEQSDQTTGSGFSVNRREFLRSGAKWTAAAAAAVCLTQREAIAAPAAEALETRVISQQSDLYHGWATLTRRTNGELWVVCSGGREEHVCPFGQVVAMTSKDEGTTWTFPRVLLDTATDDRDAGIVETSKGTLLVTTFTSLAYESGLQKAMTDGSWTAEKIARWKAAQDRLTAEERKTQLGEWLIRSTDGGRSWSQPIPTVVNSPHGPVVLRDGRLLYAGKQLWTGEGKIGVAESTDDGMTWKWLAEIPTRPRDNLKKDYHELHMVEASDGTLVTHIRMEGAVNENETLQTESTDGGRTWSIPHPISVWGLPSHLLRLKDGRLLMSYGYRRKPFGNQARLSEDHGRTWSEPINISEDGIRGDLGYPSTVELSDGSFLTVWYESMKDQPKAVLRQARWRLKQ